MIFSFIGFDRKLEFQDRYSPYKILHDTNYFWKWNSIYALQWFNMVWKDFNGIFEVLSKTLWIETAHRINHTIPCTYVDCKQLLKHSRSQVFLYFLCDLYQNSYLRNNECISYIFLCRCNNHDFHCDLYT